MKQANKVFTFFFAAMIAISMCWISACQPSISPGTVIKESHYESYYDCYQEAYKKGYSNGYEEGFTSGYLATNYAFDQSDPEYFEQWWQEQIIFLDFLKESWWQKNMYSDHLEQWWQKNNIELYYELNKLKSRLKENDMNPDFLFWQWWEENYWDKL